MPTITGGMARFDVNDPEDAQKLVTTGMAWRGGPKTLQVIFAHITEGRVTRAPDREPPEVRAYLDKVAPLPPAPAAPLQPGETLPDPEVEVEEPIVDEAEPPVA